jgi:hypothetical protein
MKKTQIQQQQYIAGMLKGKAKVEILLQYAKEMQIIESLNVKIASDIANAKDAGNEAAADELTHLTAEAWKVARQRARIHSTGGSAYRSKKRGKQINHTKYNSLSDKDKKKFEKVIRDGTGQPVEDVKLAEMFLAAKAALMDGHKTLTGKAIEKGQKAASAACAMELRRGLQMPLFDDVMKAQKYWDNKHERMIEEFPKVEQIIDPQQYGDDENRLRILLTARREARLRLTSYWKSSSSRQWKSSLIKDLILLREVVASACAGRAFAGEHDSSRRKSLRLMSERLHLRVNKPLMANEMQDIMETRRVVSHKPLKTIKLWRSSGAKWVEYTQPEQVVKPKAQTIELETHTKRKVKVVKVMKDKSVAKPCKLWLSGEEIPCNSVAFTWRMIA